MDEIDVKINHITPSGGNVFIDLGFKPEEAQKYKEHAEWLLQQNTSRKAPASE